MATFARRNSESQSCGSLGAFMWVWALAGRERQLVRTAFGTQSLAPGIYHYTLVNAQGVIGQGILAIQH